MLGAKKVWMVSASIPGNAVTFSIFFREADAKRKAMEWIEAEMKCSVDIMTRLTESEDRAAKRLDLAPILDIFNHYSAVKIGVTETYVQHEYRPDAELDETVAEHPREEVETKAPSAASPPARTFTLSIGSVQPARKIAVIKEVRAITGLSLKETKDLVDAGEQRTMVVKTGMSLGAALDAKRLLEAAGAAVELK